MAAATEVVFIPLAVGCGVAFMRPNVPGRGRSSRRSASSFHDLTVEGA
jgi:hypothetical protein